MHLWQLLGFRVPNAPLKIACYSGQVYLAGEEALHAAELAAEDSLERWPPVKKEWRASCMAHNPEWEFRLWNLSAMTDLLAQQYPWFLPTFMAYPQLIHKGWLQDETRFQISSPSLIPKTLRSGVPMSILLVFQCKLCV